jgi:hypothetical protein
LEPKQQSNFWRIFISIADIALSLWFKKQRYLEDFWKFYGIADCNFEIDYNSIKRDFVDKERKENLQKLYQELSALGDLRNNSSVLKDALMINLAYAFDLTIKQIAKVFWQSLLVFDLTHEKQYILLPLEEDSESSEYVYVSIWI